MVEPKTPESNKSAHRSRMNIFTIRPLQGRELGSLHPSSNGMTRSVMLVLGRGRCVRKVTDLDDWGHSAGLLSAGIFTPSTSHAATRPSRAVLPRTGDQEAREGSRVLLHGPRGRRGDRRRSMSIGKGCKSPHKHLGVKQLPEGWSLDELVYPLPQATPLSVRHPLGRCGSRPVDRLAFEPASVGTPRQRNAPHPR